MEYPKCPMCEADYTYEQDSKFMCPMCQHEWVASDSIVVIKDAFGNVLKDGDSVTLVKELKVKGSTQSLKQGTKVKNIRLVEGDQNIDCKIDGFGAMSLKSEFVKKI